MKIAIAAATCMALGTLLTAMAWCAENRGADTRPGEGKLKVGDPAPDFELKYEGKTKAGTVKLSSFKGKQPVVLVFGSYT